MHKSRFVRTAVVLVTLLGCWNTVRAAELPVKPLEQPKVYPGWLTPKKFEKLAPHPRLFVSQAQIDRMLKGRGAEYAALYEKIERAAELGLRDTERPMANESPFARAFSMFGRLLSLSIQWHRTHDRKFIEAAVKNIQGMGPWLDPNDDIELWQGQEIAAIAIAYDMLYNDMTAEQRATVVGFARRHCADLFLRVTGSRENPMVEGERGSWWQGIISNWNPVCTSGAGMLALTMYEDLPDAQTMIDRVQRSYEPILAYLQKTRGGWVEGLGYWNWTIHYMSLFMVSYERATGAQYPEFRSEGFKQTLLFMTHFVPYDEACGFGDNQHGSISDSLLQAAEQLGYKDLLKQLQDYRARYDRYSNLRRERLGANQHTPAKPASEGKVNISYGEPLQLLTNPDPVADVPSQPAQKNYVHVYPTQGWGMVADRWPEPTIYASFKGGVAGGAHTHADLLSWNGMVGTERMILDYHHAGYYAPSFGGRAWEIYERSPAVKNTIFVAGLAMYTNTPRARSGPAQAVESVINLPNGPAVRLEATRAYFFGSGNPRLVARVFMTLVENALLVLDRVETPGTNPVEVRTHTDKHAEFGKSDVLLKGDLETARMTFASDQPCVLRQTAAMLTDGATVPPTVMRWQTVSGVRETTMASLLSRGSDAVELVVMNDGKFITITATGKKWRHEVRLTRSLELPADAAPSATDSAGNAKR